VIFFNVAEVSFTVTGTVNVVPRLEVPVGAAVNVIAPVDAFVVVAQVAALVVIVPIENLLASEPAVVTVVLLKVPAVVPRKMDTVVVNTASSIEEIVPLVPAANVWFSLVKNAAIGLPPSAISAIVIAPTAILAIICVP
tara:strand:- start:99 stop:515 length:417 start_codon:yes stop_codon:yes gene_type:complete